MLLKIRQEQILFNVYVCRARGGFITNRMKYIF